MGALFEELDDLPIASASVAQVHVGATAQGVAGTPTRE